MGTDDAPLKDLNVRTKNPNRSRAQIHYGWVVVLSHNGKCKAMPASGTVIDQLTPEAQQKLPSLCGVWLVEQEAIDVIATLPVELQPLAEVLPVSIKVRVC